MECDVLVIGAGVSGCVSALNLTKQRINTIVLEKEKEVGLHTKNKIDITEDSGIMPIINELNIPIMQRINKTKWFSRNYSFNLKSKTYDLYFKRGSSSDCFEKQMSKKIIKNKGIFYTDVKKIKFVYKKNIVEIVKVYYKNKSIIIRPKIIIGADGKNSVVLNSTALKKEKKSFEITGYGHYSKNENEGCPNTYIFFDRYYCPGGYFFLGVTKNNCVSCIVIDKTLTKKPVKEYYESFMGKNKVVKTILKNTKKINNFSGSGNISFVKKRHYGNIMLVGDAGRVTDPVFGYGVKNSILSGYIASNIAIKAIKEKNINIIKTYDYELLSKIPEIKKIYMRKLFQNLDNKDFDNIIKIFFDLEKKGINISSLEEKNDIFVKTLLLNPRTTLRIVFKFIFSFFQ